MSKKRGQATLFMILLVILVLAVGFGMFFDKEKLMGIETGTEKVLTTEDRNVQTFVQTCLELTAKNGLFYLGYVGGKLTPDPFPAYHSIDSTYKVPYFYLEEKNVIPIPYKEQYWTELLDRYIYNYFSQCIDDFSGFPIKIEAGQLSSSTKFAQKSVIFTINYPVKVTREDFQTANLPELYTATIPLRLREILQVSSTIVDREVKNDRYIHWDYLTQVTNRNYNITAHTENNQTIIYRIIDLENEIDDEPYILQFANGVR